MVGSGFNQRSQTNKIRVCSVPKAVSCASDAGAWSPKARQPGRKTDIGGDQEGQLDLKA